jgi:plastocyanin
MKRTALFTAAAALATSLAVAVPSMAGSSAATPLAGADGPGFTITLKKGGNAVKTLPHGSYVITVKDASASHNFHIFGPGVAKVVTSVSFVGTKKVAVTLQKGTYTFQCDPHAKSGMKGTFKVT